MKTMNKRIYPALKERIFIKPLKNGKYCWYFWAGGLNEELGYEFEDEVDSIAQHITWNGNWWNLAQHVFSFISDYKDIELRLVAKIDTTRRDIVKNSFLTSTHFDL